MRLGVNIDHVATIRQARRTDEPDPVLAAFLADRGGADGIVVHLREDRRHIQERDLHILRRTVNSHLNLEMAATQAMVDTALAVAPDTCTLVPEKREEITTEGGLDVAGCKNYLAEIVRQLKDGGRRVSVFIDPEESQIEASVSLGAQAVEIHTGTYANSRSEKQRERTLIHISEAARKAMDAGLEVAAGHGLTYHNVLPVAAIPEIEELNIGHSIIARAVFSGLEQAVADMVALIRQARLSS
jgi:pyridoxine 5-phosphate synthase